MVANLSLALTLHSGQLCTGFPLQPATCLGLPTKHLLNNCAHAGLVRSGSSNSPHWAYRRSAMSQKSTTWILSTSLFAKGGKPLPTDPPPLFSDSHPVSTLYSPNGQQLTPCLERRVAPVPPTHTLLFALYWPLRKLIHWGSIPTWTCTIM